MEVLSRSTADDDRGDKFERDKRIVSLRPYVLVSHLEREIEVWSRGATADAWSRTLARAGEHAVLDSIGARLAVTELYDAAEEPRSS